MSDWLNTEKKIWKADKIKKPRHKLGFCPYGKLIEEFPLKEKCDEYSCETFGHDCPVYYHAEGICEC